MLYIDSHESYAHRNMQNTKWENNIKTNYNEAPNFIVLLVFKERQWAIFPYVAQAQLYKKIICNILFQLIT
jgi:hypothetical protein